MSEFRSVIYGNITLNINLSMLLGLVKSLLGKTYQKVFLLQSCMKAVKACRNLCKVGRGKLGLVEVTAIWHE